MNNTTHKARKSTFSRNNKPGPGRSKWKMQIYFPNNCKPPETWYTFPKYDKRGARSQFEFQHRTLVNERHGGNVTSVFFKDANTDKVLVRMYGGEIKESLI